MNNGSRFLSFSGPATQWRHESRESTPETMSLPVNQVFLTVAPTAILFCTTHTTAGILIGGCIRLSAISCSAWKFFAGRHAANADSYLIGWFATTPAQRRTVLPCSIRSVVSAFLGMAARSACASSFSRLARRSLALRPAHSRCHRSS
jgi:hypothetical protein